MKFFKAAQKCYSTETYFNPVQHVMQGMLCWKKHMRCFCGFRLADDLFCFWENPGCIILSMSMNSSMKWPIKSYFHMCLSFMKWVIPQTIQQFFCYSESSCQKKKKKAQRPSITRRTVRSYCWYRCKFFVVAECGSIPCCFYQCQIAAQCPFSNGIPAGKDLVIKADRCFWSSEK